MDLGAQFCEHCGRDRDWFVSTRSTYRDCPICGAACCADCWNLADGACLKCAPFRLFDTVGHGSIVIAPERAGNDVPLAADPYADLRANTPPEAARARPIRTSGAAPIDSGIRTSGAAREAPEAAPVAVATPVHGRTRPRRHAGRVGLAASAAWIIVAAVTVAAFGATPNRAQAPTEAPPLELPSPVGVPVSGQTPGSAASVPPVQASPSPRAAPGHPTPGPRSNWPWAPPPSTPGPTTGTPGAVVTPPPFAGPTASPTPTANPTGTPGVVVTPPPFAGPTASPTPTVNPTVSPEPWPTPSPGYVPWPTPDGTWRPTPTPTPTPEVTPTPTPEVTPTPTPEVTPTPTPTP